MALINLIPRDYHVLIDGLDCTTAVTQINGGYSHRDQSGLCKMSGSLEIKRPIDWTEDLDDRTNPRWARGKSVTVSLLNRTTQTLEPAPIIGSARILKSEYDGIRTLQIEFGCVLSLLDGWTPPGKGFCIPLKDDPDWTPETDPKTVQNIAKAILATYGITELIGTLSGRLAAPLSKSSEGSLIAMFGKLCYADGQFAFQNRHGQIEVRPVALQPDPIATQQVEFAQAWTRLTGIETPCEKIRVTGTKLQAVPVADLEPTITYERGPAAAIAPNATGGNTVLGWRQESQTLETDPDNPLHRETITQVLERKRAGMIFPDEPGLNKLTMIWFEKTTTTNRYEDRTEGGCTSPDEGRILVKDEVIKRPQGIAISDWIANKEAEADGEFQISKTLLITAEQNTTTYTYSDGDIPIQIETIQRLPTAAIVPEETGLGTPTTLSRSKRTLQYWQEVRPGEWVEVLREWEAYILAFPEIIEALEIEEEKIIPLGTKLALVQTKNERKPSNTGQSQPPNPERFPPDANVKEIPLAADLKLPSPLSDYAEREREFSLEAGYAQSVAQLENLAEVEGAFLWGRWKGRAFAFALEDALFDIAPLDCMDWMELDGHIYSYWLDGLSIAIESRQCILAADGVWVGLRGVGEGGAAAPVAPIFRKVLPWRIEEGWEFSVHRRIQGGYDVPALRLFMPSPVLRLRLALPFIPSRILRNTIPSLPRLTLSVPDSPVLNVTPSEYGVPRLTLSVPDSPVLEVSASGAIAPRLTLLAPGSPVPNLTPSEYGAPRLTLSVPDSPVLNFTPSEYGVPWLTLSVPDSPVLEVSAFGAIAPRLTLLAPGSPVLNLAPSEYSQIHLHLEIP